jgi:DNA topoisomerase-1
MRLHSLSGVGRRRPGALPPSHLCAAAAGLRYVSDEGAGLRRVRSGRGFRYLDAVGRTVRDPAVRARIRALAIPPAWTDVWICPHPDGHVQATGRDARGRKQYRYHPAWGAMRNQTKFERMVEFGLALPRIRARVDADLARGGLPREKVLAVVVRLLERSLIRVGCDEYARANDAYGLATLCARHVRVTGPRLLFAFRGKGGKAHRVVVDDRRAARIVKHCMELPGREVFQYIDPAGKAQRIDSGDVNDYLRAISAGEFTAKDFRTWGATLLAAVELAGAPPRALGERRRCVLETLQAVSNRLGNTAAVCRKYYVNPLVLDAFQEGELRRRLGLARRGGPPATLERAEQALLAFLRSAAPQRAAA